MNKYKKGFTMIELLVVVALMTVALGVVTLSAASLSDSNQQKCLYNIDSAITRCKINTLYRAQPVVAFAVEGGRITARYYEDGELVDQKRMGSGVTVTYKVGDDVYDISERPLYIGFVRGKGSFKPLEDVEIEGVGGNSVEGECTEIRVARGDSAYVITLVPATGNHKVGV